MALAARTPGLSWKLMLNGCGPRKQVAFRSFKLKVNGKAALLTDQALGGQGASAKPLKSEPGKPKARDMRWTSAQSVRCRSRKRPRRLWRRCLIGPFQASSRSSHSFQWLLHAAKVPVKKEKSSKPAEKQKAT